MPKVYNKHHRNAPPTAKYCGRGSLGGNPFIIGKDGDRDDVCNRFELMVEHDDELKAAIIAEYKSFDLVCFCKPLRCHGDYILKICEEARALDRD